MMPSVSSFLSLSLALLEANFVWQISPVFSSIFFYPTTSLPSFCLYNFETSLIAGTQLIPTWHATATFTVYGYDNVFGPMQIPVLIVPRSYITLIMLIFLTIPALLISIFVSVFVSDSDSPQRGAKINTESVKVKVIKSLLGVALKFLRLVK